MCVREGIVKPVSVYNSLSDVHIVVRLEAIKDTVHEGESFRNPEWPKYLGVASIMYSPRSNQGSQMSFIFSFTTDSLAATVVNILMLSHSLT